MNRMKNNIHLTALLFILFTVPFIALAQKESVKNNVVLNLGYYMSNNRVMYLMANAKTKVEGKFKPANGITMRLFLGNDSSQNLIGKVITDQHGLAKAIIPPALKNKWNGSFKHSFLAISEANKQYESATAEASITKSKIYIDTVSDGVTRSVMAKVSSFDGIKWMPAAGVEMKIGISRAGGGILSVGEKETYTTDSTGTVTAEFNKKGLPGDEHGLFMIVAKVDENEFYGNLLVEKLVPWGVVVKPDNSFFDQRTLWSTRFKTPFWLLFMAYSIVIGVWGTIVYLIMQIIKIKKLGMENNVV